MDVTQGLALALDPTLIFKAQGRDCDPWQRDLLFSSDRQILLNCCRQSGKSTTVAALALHTALFQPGSLTLLLSRAQRQAYELFRKTLDAYNALKRPVPAVKENQSELELANKSRIVALPGREENIRSFSGVSLLLIDEAAKVPDDLVPLTIILAAERTEKGRPTRTSLPQQALRGQGHKCRGWDSPPGTSAPGGHPLHKKGQKEEGLIQGWGSRGDPVLRGAGVVAGSPEKSLGDNGLGACHRSERWWQAGSLGVAVTVGRCRCGVAQERSNKRR